jgi:DNA-binding transcriptional MerR regulator
MVESDTTALPDKIYFKIGEVSEIVGVEPYVLRYWESEFSALKPSKSRSQQRMYKKRDVELLLKIKKLLYDEMYTIAGAKKKLTRSGEKNPSPQMSLELSNPPKNTDVIEEVEKELKDLLAFIEEKKK